MTATPWTLTSTSIDFAAQGLASQNIIQLTGPRPYFSGIGGRFFAADTVSPNTVTLRVPMKAPGVGQPPTANPVPPGGIVTGVQFVCNTFQSLIEDASFDLKSRFGIDENIQYRSSMFTYVGAEDPYRDVRAACVLQVLLKAYRAEVRDDKGDWALKITRTEREYSEVLDRVQIRWGIFGTSAPPSTIFNCKLSR